MKLTVDPKKFDAIVGIDVAKKNYAMTYLNHNYARKTIGCSSDPKKVYHYCQKHYPEQEILYVYEAGGTGYGLHDFLTNQQAPCIIVHPPSIPKAPKDRVKNDKIDSRKLAELTLGGHLHGIRVPSAPYRELRHLSKTRHEAVKDSVRAKLRIKALLLFENIQLPNEIEENQHWSSKYCQALRKISVKNASIRYRLDHLLNQLDFTKKSILDAVRQIRLFYKQYPDIHKNFLYLKSIPGFGFVVSTYMLSRVGDPSRLKHLKELGGFAGLTSSENSTGGVDNKGSITHMGDPILRSLLIEGAWIAIRKDRELNQFFCRIRAKHSKKIANKKAITAVARKLTERAYRVLKDQREYVIR